MQRDMIHRIGLLESTKEYVTMSGDSIRFWDRSDLHFKRVINQPGMFADFVTIEAIQKIVVKATSRRLMFFDLESLQKLPAEINASPLIHAIKRMSADQALVAAAVLQAPKIPLANCPTMMCIGPEIDSHRFSFFVGDD
jgi:hypothetical protein